MKNVMIFAIVFITITACGVQNEFNGKVGGKSLIVHDAIAVRTMDPSSPDGKGYSVSIVLGDSSSLCDDAKKGILRKGATEWSMVVAQVDGGVAGSVATGTYDFINIESLTTAPTGSVATGVFETTDSTCTASEVPVLSASGSVKLDKIGLGAGGITEGTYSATLTSGETVSGTFSAAYCDVPMTSSANPTCM